MLLLACWYGGPDRFVWRICGVCVGGGGAKKKGKSFSSVLSKIVLRRARVPTPRAIPSPPLSSLYTIIRGAICIAMSLRGGGAWCAWVGEGGGARKGGGRGRARES